MLDEKDLRLDDLGRGGFKLFQNPSRFCFGLDAVVLSSFCKIAKDETALDLGTGNGVLPVLLCAKTAGRFVGLEIQSYEVELAEKNVDFNGLRGRVRIDGGDIRLVSEIYPRGGFDAVVSNPPYQNSKSENVAKHEVLCALGDVIGAAAWALKFGGKFFLVHRPERMADIFCLCRENGLEVKEIRFVQAREGAKPSLVLVRAKKGASAGVGVAPPLIIYGADGKYTEETEKIYYG